MAIDDRRRAVPDLPRHDTLLHVTPSDPPFATITSTTWTDNAPNNHYYVVLAADAGGGTSINSNRTGKFTFALTPGS